MDMRGYGDSERPENVDAYHIDNLIEDVRGLIRELGTLLSPSLRTSQCQAKSS